MSKSQALVSHVEQGTSFDSEVLHSTNNRAGSSGVRGRGGKTALVVGGGDLEVSLHSPCGSPRVLDNPESTQQSAHEQTDQQRETYQYWAVEVPYPTTRTPWSSWVDEQPLGL